MNMNDCVLNSSVLKVSRSVKSFRKGGIISSVKCHKVPCLEKPPF